MPQLTELNGSAVRQRERVNGERTLLSLDARRGERDAALRREQALERGQHCRPQHRLLNNTVNICTTLNATRNNPTYLLLSKSTPLSTVLSTINR